MQFNWFYILPFTKMQTFSIIKTASCVSIVIQTEIEFGETYMGQKSHLWFSILKCPAEQENSWLSIKFIPLTLISICANG